MLREQVGHHLLEQPVRHRDRADNRVAGRFLRPQAPGQLADRQQGGVAEGATTGEGLVGELVAGIDGGHTLGPDLELEAEQLVERARLAALKLSQPGPRLVVDVVGQHGRLLHEEPADTVTGTGADPRLGGQADELIGILDLPQRNGEQVAHQVAADEEQGLGPGVVGEGGDRTVVLDQHPPGHELAQGGDEGPPIGVAVAAEVDAGLGGRMADLLDQGRQQHLLAASEQHRAAKSQVGVGAG